MVFGDSARQSIDGPVALVIKGFLMRIAVLLDVVGNLSSCFRMMEEVSDLLSEEVFPDVDGGHGDNHDITQRNEDEKHSLLEASYGA